MATDRHIDQKVEEYEMRSGERRMERTHQKDFTIIDFEYSHVIGGLRIGKLEIILANK